MAEDFNAKIRVDVSDAKANIASLNSQIRVLESGFKASAAEVDNWQDDIGKCKERASTLTSVMELQKQKLANLEAKYEDVTSTQDVNSTAALRLQNAINKEREALNKNGTELRKVNGRLEELEDSSEDAGDELGDLEDSADGAGDGLGEVGDEAEKAGGGLSTFLANASHLGDVIGNVKDIVKGIVNVIKSVAEAAWNAATGFAEMADNLLTLSANTGIDPQTLQAMGYNSGLYDVEMSTWEGLLRSMMTGTTRDKLAGAGISLFDDAGRAVDNLTLLKQVLAEASQLYNTQGMGAADEWLTGLGFRAGTVDDLNTLLKTDESGLSNLARYWAQVDQWISGGFTTSDADLAIGGGLQDALDQLDVIKQALENLVGAGIADIITPFIETLNSNLTDLIQLWSEIRADGEVTDEERTALIEKAKETVSTLWEDLSAEGGALDTLGTALWNAVKAGWEIVSPWFEETMKKVGSWIWDGVSDALEGWWEDFWHIGADAPPEGELPMGQMLDYQVMQARYNAGMITAEEWRAYQDQQIGEAMTGMPGWGNWGAPVLAGSTNAEPVEVAAEPVFDLSDVEPVEVPAVPMWTTPEGEPVSATTEGWSFGVGGAVLSAMSDEAPTLATGLVTSIDDAAPSLVAAAGNAADEAIATMQTKFGQTRLTVGGVDVPGVTNINFGGVSVQGGRYGIGDISGALNTYTNKYMAGKGGR